jgi:pilus assembly protein Flp/PilA
MDTTTPRFSRQAAAESGATAIEYGLLSALIAVAILGAVSACGTSLKGVYEYWSTAVTNAL